MEPNKVYASISYLLNNLLNSNESKYMLIKNSEIKNLFVQQVNNLLFLEKDNDAKLNDTLYAISFGKGIVKLTGENLKIVKTENKSIDEIYGEYSIFISRLTSEYDFKRSDLTNENIQINEKEIILNAILSNEERERIEYLREQEEMKLEKNEEAKVQQQKDSKSKEQHTNNSSFQDFGNNTFNQIPVHPMQEARFYPFKTKPKSMPILKWALFVFSIIAAIALQVTIVYGSVKFIDVSDVSSDNVEKISITKVTLIGGTETSVLQMILSIVFSLLPSVYILYDIQNSKRVVKNKYRLGLFAMFFLLIMVGYGIFDVCPALSTESLAKSISVTIVNNATLKTDAKANDVYSEILPQIRAIIENHQTDSYRPFKILAMFAMILMVITLPLGIYILIINPKYDRERIARANFEFQRKIAAAMNGQNYEIDQSIYDIQEEKNEWEEKDK